MKYHHEGKQCSGNRNYDNPVSVLIWVFVTRLREAFLTIAQFNPEVTSDREDRYRDGCYNQLKLTLLLTPWAYPACNYFNFLPLLAMTTATIPTTEETTPNAPKIRNSRSDWKSRKESPTKNTTTSLIASVHL